MKRAILLALLLAAGCRTQRILNLSAMPTPTYSDGSRPSEATVKNAILGACNQRGWAATPQRDGLIAATILVRAHLAAINIYYTPDNYSILYANSNNLKYNNGKIHRNYNRWILVLHRTIMQNLGAHSQNF